MPPGSSAIAKAGRANLSFSRDATSPTTPGCQPSDAVTITAPLSSRPSAASASASACASAACSIDAALAVEAVEFGGDPRGLRDIALQQQPHAEIGAADAAAGIDARPEHEAEMPGLRRAVEPRHVHQRGEADMVAAAQRDQSLGDEGAVEPGQRHDVGDGAERDVMQHAEQIRLRPLAGPEAARAQFAVDRDQRDEHEADGGEMAEPGEIVEPVRIDQRIDLGQFVAALMMIDHDHVHAEPFAPPPAARGWWCRNRP